MNVRRIHLVIMLGAILLSVGASVSLIAFVVGTEVLDADIKNDWLMAKALVRGDDPYSDLNELSDRYVGGSYIPPDADPTVPPPLRGPRTPGAVALSLPLLLVDFDSLVRINTVFSLACIFTSYVLVSLQVRKPAATLWAMAALLSHPTLWQVVYSNVSALVALLVVTTCILASRSDSRWAGVVLGIAVTIKTYPLILVALLSSRRQWRAVSALLASLLVLNLVPLLLPWVPVSHALEAVVDAGRNFASISSNMSLTHFIEQLTGSPALAIGAFSVIVGGSLIWVHRRSSAISLDGLFLMSVGTLMAPLSWPHYLLGVVPLAAWTFHSSDAPERIRLLIAVSAALTLVPHAAVTQLSLFLLVITSGVGRWVTRSERQQAPIELELA